MLIQRNYINVELKTKSLRKKYMYMYILYDYYMMKFRNQMLIGEVYTVSF